jgi:sarcosine oxidase subunit beta
MMAPAVAELYADFMTGHGEDEVFARFQPDRFSRGTPVREDFIIG